MEAILAACPPVTDPTAPGRHWSDWSYRNDPFGFNRNLPPLRVLLIWDNLAGHHTSSLVDWCHAHGIWLLFTPLAGSWLNMASRPGASSSGGRWRASIRSARST